MEASEVKQITRSLHRYAYGFWQADLLAQIRERVILVAETVKQDQRVRRCIAFWGCVVQCQCICLLFQGTGARRWFLSGDVHA